MIFLMISVVIFLSSCSTTLDFHVPTQNFMTPEVVGKSLAFRGQASFSNSTKFRLAKLEQANIFDSSTEISTEQGTTKDNVLNLTGGVGIGTGIELTYRSYPDSPDLFGVKAQILGRDDGTKTEGLKLSVHGGYGSGEVDNKSLNSTSITGQSRDYNAVLDVEGIEFGGTVGYRMDKKLLPYFSYNYRIFDAVGDLTSTSFANQTIDGTARVLSMQLGLNISFNRLQLMVEGGYADSRWREAERREDYTLGLSVGFTSI